MNQRLFCFVVFLFANTNAFSQEKTTIKIIDALSNKPIQNVNVVLNDSTYLSNPKGYCQFFSEIGDTMAILHPEYESIYVFQPETRLYVITLNRLEEYLEFSDGIAVFYRQILENLPFPSKARRNKVQRAVCVEFQIDSVGGMTNIQVHNDPDKMFTDVILEVMNKMNGTWEPNYVGKRFVLHITFKFSYSIGREQINCEFDSTIDRILTEIVVVAY